MAHDRDDPSISDEERLWRRIWPNHVSKSKDPIIPQSRAFRDNHTGEVSVHRADLITPEDALAEYPTHYLVEITAGQVRALGEYAVVADPIVDDPSHALILPSPTRGDAKRLARQAQWIVPDDPLDITS